MLCMEAWDYPHIPTTFHIPGTDDDPPAVWLLFDLINHFGQLIHPLSRVVRVRSLVFCPEVSPLEPVDWAEVTFLSGMEAALVEELARPVRVPDFHSLRR